MPPLTGATEVCLHQSLAYAAQGIVTALGSFSQIIAALKHKGCHFPKSHMVKAVSSQKVLGLQSYLSIFPIHR